MARQLHSASISSIGISRFLLKNGVSQSLLMIGLCFFLIMMHYIKPNMLLGLSHNCQNVVVFFYLLYTRTRLANMPNFDHIFQYNEETVYIAGMMVFRGTDRAAGFFRLSSWIEGLQEAMREDDPDWDDVQRRAKVVIEKLKASGNLRPQDQYE